MTERSVGGAARGPISLGDGSSPSVPAPFSETATIRRLRSMLSSRDSTVDAFRRFEMWWTDKDRAFYQKADAERRMIRERIKKLAWLKKAK